MAVWKIKTHNYITVYFKQISSSSESESDEENMADEEPPPSPTPPPKLEIEDEEGMVLCKLWKYEAILINCKKWLTK